MNLLRFVTGSFKEAPTVRDVDVSLLVFDDGIFRNISMVPPSLFEKRTDNGLFNWIANFPIHLWRKKIFSPDEQIVSNERWNIIESWRLRRRWICCCFRNCSKKRQILKLPWNTLYMVLIYRKSFGSRVKIKKWYAKIWIEIYLLNYE